MANKRQPIPFGKYLLLDRVNIGGMAEVWKAKTFGEGGFEKLIAIKRILPNIAEDQEFITMFIDEAKISVQLSHANVAQVFDLGKIGESYYIAMEYISGKDLRAIFDKARKRGEPAPIPLTCYALSKAAEGLDYAHRKKDPQGNDIGIVHRDVSPQNILVSYDGESKVIDFGIAKAASRATKTQAGILKGKFGYMSPEQVRGLPLDRRSDVFALGVVLYEMLTGERLFVGESDFSVLEKVRAVDILPPSTYNRRIPPALEKIVLKALAKDVEDRFQYASELSDELQRFLITSDSIFSRKDLQQFMKSTFAEDVEREKVKIAEYADVKMSAGIAAQLGLKMPPGSAAAPQQTAPAPAPAPIEIPESDRTQIGQQAPPSGDTLPPGNMVGGNMAPAKPAGRASSPGIPIPPPRNTGSIPALKPGGPPLAPRQTGTIPAQGGANGAPRIPGPPVGVGRQPTGMMSALGSVPPRAPTGQIPALGSKPPNGRPVAPARPPPALFDDNPNDATLMPGSQSAPRLSAVNAVGREPIGEDNDESTSRSVPVGRPRKNTDDFEPVAPPEKPTGVSRKLLMGGVGLGGLLIAGALGIAFWPHAVGSIVVQPDATGSGATVLVDGKPSKTGGMAFSDLPEGTHQVVVSASGFEPFQQQITVAKDETKIVPVHLKKVGGDAPPEPPKPVEPPKVSAAVVESEGAQILLDGTEVRAAGATDMWMAQVDATKEHTLILKKEKFKDVQLTFKPGETIKWSGKLEAETPTAPDPKAKPDPKAPKAPAPGPAKGAEKAPAPDKTK